MQRSVAINILGILVAAHIGHTAWASESPNIVIILADDLGFADLGCYGGEIETPHLNRLADQGLRFTHFYNCGRCWPTRAALMTGYYAQQVRRDQLPEIPSGAGGKRPAWGRLLAAMLRPAGYRSYHSGKWHIDGPRLPAGFDRSYCLDDHDRYFSPKSHSLNDQPLPAHPTETPFYATTAIADHAIESLREHAAHHADTPFFSYVCFTAPHFPLQASAADIAPYRETYQVGWNVIRQRRHARQLQLGIVQCPLSAVETNIGPPYDFPDAMEKLGPHEINRPITWESLTGEQQRFQAAKMAVHAAMVNRMDQEIGRIVDQLRTMQALEQTLICFLSDNGASAEIMVRGDGHNPDAPAGSSDTFLSLGPGWSNAANTPFRRHKTWVHEGGIATPLIVHWPAGINARGELRHSHGHVIDIVPTVLDLAGLDSERPTITPPDSVVPPPFPGRSLRTVLDRDNTVSRESLWWLHEGNRAILVGSWKLVAAKNQPWQFFDLQTDRSETHDRSGDYPDRVHELAQQWQTEFEQIQTTATLDLAK